MGLPIEQKKEIELSRGKEETTRAGRNVEGEEEREMRRKNN